MTLRQSGFQHRYNPTFLGQEINPLRIVVSFFFFLLTSSTTYLSLSSHCCVLLQMWHCLDTFVLGLGQETCTGCDVMLYLKGEAM